MAGRWEASDVVRGRPQSEFPGGDVVAGGERPQARGLSVPFIRPARLDDLRTIGEIERATFSDPWTLGAFRSVLDSGRATFLVATSREEPLAVLGYAVLWMILDEAELSNLAVSPPSRGRGVGAALLDAIVREAEGQGALSIFLEVRDSNAVARALYQSRGFDEAGRRRRYYRGPVEDAIIMRRQSCGS